MRITEEVYEECLEKTMLETSSGLSLTQKRGEESIADSWWVSKDGVFH